jgi:hypothetical protein
MKIAILIFKQQYFNIILTTLYKKKSMKKLFAILIICFSFILNGIAQPNGGFENWHNEFSYQVPDSWQTYNFMSILTPPNPLSATKATGIDAHSGNYALKLKTIYFNNNPLPSQVGDTSGATFTGKLTVTPFTLKYGFAYTDRPANIEFWAKYIPVGGDTAGVGVVFRKWNGVSHDTVGVGTLNINLTTAYTLFQVPITYFLPEIPDTAVVAFVSSKFPTIARPNSTLYVDDVLFTGVSGISENNISEKKVKVFPNPARNNITITAQIEEANNVEVFDSYGKFCGSYKIQNNSASINTTSFIEGTYFYAIRNKNDITIAGGKFNIVK